MSRSGQSDQGTSYMDGVQVKIAEAYKPPRKFGLPAAYNNKVPDVTKYTYDFSLEKSVQEKVKEWRKARLALAEARKARLERRKKRAEETASSTPSPPSPAEPMIPLPVRVAPAPETTILTPQPLSPPHSDLHNIDIHVKSNRLNYEDFYNDTSSPFDNVELKTINDMEELAQVLQPNQWIPAPKIESILKELSIEGAEEKRDEVEDKAEDKNDNDVQEEDKRRNISIIVEELQRTLRERPSLDNWKPWPDLESPDIETTPEPKQFPTAQSPPALPNPLAELSESDKKLAKHLNDMGFPLSRAARAIENLGTTDNKKVVEYLLAVQSLEESGISSHDAEKAMDLTQHDPKNAKKFHENLCTLKDLGFPEDVASKALLKCDIDRDKALDFLCA